MQSAIEQEFAVSAALSQRQRDLAQLRTSRRAGLDTGEQPAVRIAQGRPVPSSLATRLSHWLALPLHRHPA